LELSDVKTRDRPGLAAPAPSPRIAEFRRRLPGQLVSFACIGVASTAAYALLYLGLRGVGVTAQVANATSLLLTAIANTAANRRLTFGVRGSENATKHLVQGMIAFGAGLALTAPALAVLHWVSAKPSHVAEVAVLIAANLLATAMRFVLYRWWVFRPTPSTPA
jgi:putative flippase GtrA